MNNKTYLGDSVYAWFDGYHIVLTTENGLLHDPSNTIALEPAVLNALRAYERQLFEQAPPQEDVEIDPILVSAVTTAKDYANLYEEALRDKGPAYTAVLQSLKDIAFTSISMDTVDLNLCLTGGKRDLEHLWGKLRHLGFEAPDERPKSSSPEWTGTFRRDDGVRIYVHFSSTVCKRVPTGRKIEVDEYDIVCDDEADRVDRVE